MDKAAAGRDRHEAPALGIEVDSGSGQEEIGNDIAVGVPQPRDAVTFHRHHAVSARVERGRVDKVCGEDSRSRVTHTPRSRSDFPPRSEFAAQATRHRAEIQDQSSQTREPFPRSPIFRSTGSFYRPANGTSSRKRNIDCSELHADLAPGAAAPRHGDLHLLRLVLSEEPAAQRLLLRAY